jgi:TolB-like protein
MTKKTMIFGLASLMLFIGGAIYAQTISLDQAISRGVSDIEEKLAPGAKVVALNYSSSSQRFSNYMIEELVTMLVGNGKLTVVDRANLELIRQELNFQMSGEVSDESARSIGRLLGAEYIISGAIEELRSNYVVRFRTIAVETAALMSLTRFDVRKDNQISILMGTEIADKDRMLILSAGTGGVFKMQLRHESMYNLDEGLFSNPAGINTNTYTDFGVPIFLDADLLSYLSLEAAMYYFFGSSPSGTTWNYFDAVFSLYLQSPKQGTERLSMTPLFGASYKMSLWEKAKGADDATKRTDLSKYDSLYLKLGGGLNFGLTDYLRLNFRATWDVLVYMNYLSNLKKDYKDRGQGYFSFRHGPNVLLGVSYMFLKL